MNFGEASRTNRLYLARSVGPLSGGTRVELLGKDAGSPVLLFMVRAAGHTVKATKQDLVVRRAHSL